MSILLAKVLSEAATIIRVGLRFGNRVVYPIVDTSLAGLHTVATRRIKRAAEARPIDEKEAPSGDSMDG